MLAARDLAVEHGPVRVYEDSRRPRALTRPRAAAKPRSRAVWFGLWLLTVLVAFSVTHRHAAITRLGYQAEGLERELAVLRKLNGELEVKVSALGAPARVQQLAQSRLGMVLPKQTVAVALERPAGTEDRPAAAGGDLTAPKAEQTGLDIGGALSRLWRLVLRLTGIPAEAAPPPR